ncbi:MAG: DUF6174 domain-containing protein [Spirochaetaceae bacterium]|nr:DUF6174 domain-containing protein [Spirochaetaceae bacterium]
MYTKFSGCAVLSGVCFLLSSCWLNPEAEVVREAFRFDQERFDRERAAWNAAGIKNYRFDVHVDGLGAFSIIRYFIENGSFKNRVFIKLGSIDHSNPGFTTIPEFYAKIERFVQEKRKEYEGLNPDYERYLIDVEYNSEYHFPIKEEVYIFSSRGDIVGSGITYAVKDFEPM